MASVTTWIRLEPRTRTPEMTTGLQARIYDPLWLLARQWQVGEFQGEDNGSPAMVRWRGESARLSRYYPGPLAAKANVEGHVYDGGALPLETLVERERVRPETAKLEKLRFAAEAGQHFLRVLAQQVLSRNYRDVFTSRYPFPPLTTEERAALDDDSQSFFALMAPRVPDGRLLYAALSAALRPVGGGSGALPSGLPIEQADRANVQMAAQTWLHWYDTLISEPSVDNPTWSAERMEYGFSVAAQLPTGEKVLTAQEYVSGHLDWPDFNVSEGTSLHAGNDGASVALTRTVIPA